MAETPMYGFTTSDRQDGDLAEEYDEDEDIGVRDARTAYTEWALALLNAHTVEVDVRKTEALVKRAAATIRLSAERPQTKRKRRERLRHLRGSRTHDRPSRTLNVTTRRSCAGLSNSVTVECYPRRVDTHPDVRQHLASTPAVDRAVTVQGGRSGYRSRRNHRAPTNMVASP
jgi:hypothetical protein